MIVRLAMDDLRQGATTTARRNLNRMLLLCFSCEI